MRFPTLSIRLRITLWNVVLLGTALIVLGAAFYVGLRFLLYDALETRLDGQAATARAALVFDNDSLAVSPGVARDDDEQFVRVWTPSGELVFDNSNVLDGPSPNPEGVAQATNGERNLRWLDVDDDDVRVLAEPIEHNGQFFGVLEVGRETDANESLEFALRIIVISIPAILLFATVGGWWLAGRALNPIDRITRTAAAIEERDLSQRIDLALPGDEVGRLATTFNAMLDRIETAFSRQRQFTADAAHELRTPLALMRSQIDVALGQERGEDTDRAILEALGADVDRLARMADSLLALARSDARGIQPSTEPVDLPDLLCLLGEQYTPLADDIGVDLVLETRPASALADHDLLIQVLVNLLDNGLHHAPPDTTIRLGCRSRNGHVEIWVADHGPGIPPEHLSRVFDRFYRVEPGRDRPGSRAPGSGIGLGLAISKAIVEAHGGQIKLANSTVGGLIVTIDLPANPTHPITR